MKITTTACALSLVALAAAVPAAAQCAHSRDVDASLDAADLAAVLIFARAGSLEVRGVDTDRVSVTGHICASDTDLLADAELNVDRFHGSARVEAILPETRWREYIRMDLVVEMPAGLGTEIDDSSGSMEVTGVASARIDDSSGDMTVERIGGDLEIDDSSGGIRIRDVAGNVRVDDSSGEIDIDGVRGGVVIVDDGSGGIDIRNVDRDVLVQDDGSGSIDVAYIGGDFTVEHDGSGGIRYREVKGRVDVPRKRH